MDTLNENINGNMIISSTGYKAIEDINVGDLVYTHKGQYKQVNRVTKKRYNDTIYSIRINGYYLPIKLSANTLVNIYRGKKNHRNKNSFTWVKAKDIQLDDMVVSIIKGNGDYCDIKYAELLGIFALRGHIESRGNVNLITESNDKVIKAIESCLSKLNIPFDYITHGIERFIRIKDYEICSLCSVFDKKFNRSLPEEIINSGIDFLKEFIKHFIVSNKSKDRMYFRATSSLALFLGYQRILIRLNSFANVYKCRSRNQAFDYYALSLTVKELESIGKCRTDIWFRNHSHTFLRVEEVSQEHYSGTINHFEVENDSTYCNHLITIKGLV